MYGRLFKLRKARSVLVAAGAAVAALAIASPAGASLAGGPQVHVSATPNLTSSSVNFYQPNTGLNASAKWCFNHQPAISTSQTNTTSRSDFFVAGYKGGQQEIPKTVFLDPSNANCVIGDFGSDHFQLPASTIGGVVTGTGSGTKAPLKDLFGNPAFADSVPFGGSYASGPVGRTTGPNILGPVNVLPGQNALQIPMDHILSGTTDHTLIGIYDSSGTFHEATTTTVGGGGNNIITAKFTSPVNVGNAYYLLIEGGAVFATDGTPTNGGSGTPEEPNATESISLNGLSTSSAAVVGARVSGPSQVDVVYDQPVACGDPDQMQITEVGGNDTTGNAFAANCQGGAEGQNSLRFTFDTGGTGTTTPVSNFIGEFVRAQDLGGAAFSIDNSNTDSIETTGAIGGSPDAPGFTSAPDFVSAAKVPPFTVGQVTIKLDQPANFTGTALDAGNFALLAPNGSTQATAQNVQLSGDGLTLTLDFPGNIAGAVGVSYNPQGTESGDNSDFWPTFGGCADNDAVQGFDCIADPSSPQAIAFSASALSASAAMARYNATPLPPAVTVAGYNANLKLRSSAIALSKHHKSHKKHMHHKK